MENLRNVYPSGFACWLVIEEKPESDDEKLLEEFYTQLKGGAKGNGYTGIPRFYAKVSTTVSTVDNVIFVPVKFITFMFV